MASPSPPASPAEPVPARQRGRRKQAELLQAAAQLFAERGLQAVSVAEIAAAARAHPHQVTYYFGSKDGLFVRAALRLLLADARRLEPIGRRQRTPSAFRNALARTAVNLPSVPLAVQAMSISEQRPELHDVTAHHLAVLFHQAAEYLSTVLDRRGWIVDRPLLVEARTFWSAVLGSRLIHSSGFGGSSSDIDLAGVLSVRER